MAKRRITDEEWQAFLATVLPMLADNATYAEIAEATGMSTAGVRYRIERLLGQTKQTRFVPLAIAGGR